MSRLKFSVLAAFLVVLSAAFAGCEKKTASATAPAPPPPEVAVVEMAPQGLTLTTELPGRVAADRVAEVRPQVNGIIQKRLFTEGADVKAGQILYQIDPAPYKAAFASAKAALARARAEVIPARLKKDRLQELVEIDAVSKQDFDDAAAALKKAEAEVEVAEAALDTARINLAYTKVKAPISGRIGRSQVTTGALVTAGQSQALATIQRLDPVFVDVTQSTAELLRLKRELAGGDLQSAAEDGTRVKLILEDGSEYPLPGILKFSDVTVNQDTASVTLRTVFPNPDHLLLPGMYVRAVVEEGVMNQAILAPQKGVTRDHAGRAVAMVVDENDQVESRILKVSRAVGDQWLVSEGLAPGDRLIVEGLQKVRPGAQVRVVSLDRESSASGPDVAKKD
jgi:membrane fusion protein (multidrug efflux system)